MFIPMLACAALVAGLAAGCECSCEPAARHGRSVVVRVVDAATGRDITASGDAGAAELILFAPDGSYVGRVRESDAQVVRSTPIRLEGWNLGRSRLCVWTNAGQGQVMHGTAAGSRVEDRAVSLVTGDDGYHGAPDDLFFGFLELAREAGEEPEVVTVMRKNARMAVTVRGLPAGAADDRYYLTVQLPNDGYDFAGNPLDGMAVVRMEGTFGERGDFQTRGAVNLIHTDAGAGAVTVNLYERAGARAADRLVVSTTEDESGLPIGLPTGRTLNLLIDLGGASGIVVRTEITPWDEIHQWENW